MFGIFLSIYFFIIYSTLVFIHSIGHSPLYISKHSVCSGSSHRRRRSSFITVHDSDFGVLYISVFPSGLVVLLIIFLVNIIRSRIPFLVFFFSFLVILLYLGACMIPWLGEIQTVNFLPHFLLLGFFNFVDWECARYSAMHLYIIPLEQGV